MDYESTACFEYKFKMFQKYLQMALYAKRDSHFWLHFLSSKM